MEYNINDSQVEDLKKEATKVTGCKTCNRKLSNTQIFLIALSAYILITSIFGTVVLIKNLFDLFS